MLHTINDATAETPREPLDADRFLGFAQTQRAVALALVRSALQSGQDVPLTEDLIHAAVFVLDGLDRLPRGLDHSPVRRFVLRRQEDETGVSGTGDVADGCVFPDGVAVLHWRGDLASTAVYRSVQEVEAIHGHGGRTLLVFADEEEL